MKGSLSAYLYIFRLYIPSKCIHKLLPAFFVLRPVFSSGRGVFPFPKHSAQCAKETGVRTGAPCVLMSQKSTSSTRPHSKLKHKTYHALGAWYDQSQKSQGASALISKATCLSWHSLLPLKNAVASRHLLQQKEVF